MKSTIRRLTSEINKAKKQEAQTKALVSSFQQHRERLHAAINISSKSPDDALCRFVGDYVDSLPEHLLAFYELANEAGVEDFVQPFLNLACTYFLKPPEMLEPYRDLESVFYKSFLCQRMLEEVNDQVMNLGGAALAPIDMSTANIICHTLIGDELANQLDYLVLLSIETADINKAVFEDPEVRTFMQQRKFNGWQQVLDRWPCFTKNCAVNLQLGEH